MEFFALLMVNIFLGVVFYLVITLKLEKSASHFREHKLRKEMDAIIQEFNETAERNISILESRIRTMRALLEKSGDLKKIDYIIDEGLDDEPSRPHAAAPAPVQEQAQQRPVYGSAATAARGRSTVAGAAFRETLAFLIDIAHGIGEAFRNRRSAPEAGVSGDSVKVKAGEIPVRQSRVDGHAAVIEKEYDDVETIIAAGQGLQARSAAVSQEDIMRVVADGRDKNGIVSRLHGMGCPEDDIARYTGIPVGEIRLILNLHGSL
jgi:hypothetical protein